MEIAKFQASGTQVHGTIPFSKVDKEKRTVRGFATLDNIDLQGDVVTFNATQKAFANSNAKIREMHQPRVAGKIASFEEAEYFDPKENKTYKGMVIEAYISKGNQNAWEMVLDGSYSAFSIAGNINESEMQFVKDDKGGKEVRFVKDYDLHEISLVDNGGNQFANFMSITKSADGSELVKGMVAETDISNVFYCETDEIARTLPDETAECQICEKDMVNIGWMDGKETETINKMIDKFVKSQEGGQTDMAEEVNEVAEVEEQPVEETPEVVETEGVENDLEKQVSELKDSVETMAKQVGEQTEARDALAEELRKEFSDKMETHESNQKEVLEKFDELAKRLEDAVNRQDDIKKQLDEVQGNLSKTATRESTEVESESDNASMKKGLWSGHFLDI